VKAKTNLFRANPPTLAAQEPSKKHRFGGIRRCWPRNLTSYDDPLSDRGYFIGLEAKGCYVDTRIYSTIDQSFA
jgi:hypothetical protein